MTSRFAGTILTPALTAAFTALLPLALGGSPSGFLLVYGLVLLIILGVGIGAAFYWAKSYPVDKDVPNNQAEYWETWWWLKYLFIGVAVSSLVMGLVGARYLGFSWGHSTALAFFHATVVTLLLWLFTYIAISQR